MLGMYKQEKACQFEHQNLLGVVTFQLEIDCHLNISFYPLQKVSELGQLFEYP